MERKFALGPLTVVGGTGMEHVQDGDCKRNNSGRKHDKENAYFAHNADDNCYEMANRFADSQFKQLGYTKGKEAVVNS